MVTLASLYRVDASSTEAGRPMTTFDDREDTFEKKFAHDEELRFKAMARRNKLFGNWVAEQLGRTGAEADAYARSLVLADFKAAGASDALQKVRADLASAGKNVSETDLRRRMDDLLAQAAAEVQAGR
jgi:hypothetical protein